MSGRDMLKWQSAVMSHLDDSDSDSDKESALSGSFMVDSVMNDLRKRGYRNSNLYRGDEFTLHPVAEVTIDEEESHQREAWSKHQPHTKAGPFGPKKQSIPSGSGYHGNQHPLSIKTPSQHPSPSKHPSGYHGNQKEHDHLRGVSHSHQQSSSGYRGNIASSHGNMSSAFYGNIPSPSSQESKSSSYHGNQFSSHGNIPSGYHGNSYASASHGATSPPHQDNKSKSYQTSGGRVHQGTSHNNALNGYHGNAPSTHQSNPSYQGNQYPSNSYYNSSSTHILNRPDSRGGASYQSSNEHISGSHSVPSSHTEIGTSQQLSFSSGYINKRPEDSHPSQPTITSMNMSMGALSHVPPQAQATSPQAQATSPTADHRSREDVPMERGERQRSRSLGRVCEQSEDETARDGKASYHSRGGSLPRSEGGSKREPDLNEAVGFLKSKDSSLVVYGASYLQHLAYGDDTMKTRIREHGAVPILISLLRHSERKVQLAVLAALRNLSFGRRNDQNKNAIAQDQGLQELVYQLRSSRSAEVRELVTGVLWNLSSCESLKMTIIKASLMDVLNYVLIGNSSWSHEQAVNPNITPRNISWTTELCNATGMLRNVSSVGEEARLMLRSARGLVDTLMWILRGALGMEEASGKTVENVMCILRNLSYRVENEVDRQEASSDDIIDKEWEVEIKREMEEERRLIDRHEGKAKKSSFSLCTKPATKESLVQQIHAHEEKTYKNSPLLTRPKRTRPLFGTPLLWQPDTVVFYIRLLQGTSNPETQEAACGAIHNITACSWKWAAFQRRAVRLSEGLPTIVSLTVSDSDAVTRAAAIALRNLSIDPLNKVVIGEQVMHKLVSRLPFGSRHQGITDSTTVTILCALIELVSESPENIRYFRQAGGAVLVSRLAKSKEHSTKIVYAANKLCTLVWEDKDGRSALKKENWEIGIFNKMTKEVGGRYDFEPRSLAKEFRGSKRNIKKSKKELSSKTSKNSSKKKKENQSSQPSPLLHSTRKINDKLPDSPKDSKAVISTLSATDNHYDTTSAPAEATQVASPNQIQFYSSLSSDEKNAVIQTSKQDARKPEPPPPTHPSLLPAEAAELYAQVDLDKKRAERKYAKQGRNRWQPSLPQQQPGQPVANDSWV